ncbi:cytochrome P450 3A13-like [Haemaphysalis longicornis]
MFAAACLALCAAALYSLYRWRKRTFSHFKDLGIPGPEPSLLFGNLLEIWQKGMARASSEWVKQYGDIVGYYNGIMPGIVLRDPELIKRIFINDFHYFTGRQIMTIVSKNLPINEVKLTRLAGDDWRYLKNIVLPAFKTSNIKKAFPLMKECIEECFSVIDSKLPTSTSELGDGCVELFELFCKMAIDVGLQMFAGARTQIQRKNGAAMAIVHASRQSVGQFGGVALFLLNLLPNIPLLHRVLLGLRSLFITLPSDEMLERMLPIINHRRAHPDPSKEDVLQLLINAEVEDANAAIKAEGKKLSDVFMARPATLRTESNTCLFINASVDAIASPLAFGCYLLSEHPEVQDRVRAEVLGLVEKEGALTYDNIGTLTYLRQVLSEVVRLYPALPGSVRRICDEDYEHNGVRILKGVNVSVPTLDFHYDLELWPEPKKFDPERFSKANQDSIRPMSYFPYGFGPRKCIASALAQMELTLALAMLVTRYRLLPSPKYRHEPPKYAASSLLGFPSEGVTVRLEKL